MRVHTTLRYLAEAPVIITEEKEICAGCTAGDLSDRIIRAEEQKRNMVFSGASIVTLVNGRIAEQDYVLEDGDTVIIMPVAAAG